MEIQYSENAVKQLKKIHKGDKKSAAMILKTIEAYAAKPSGKLDVKVLRGNTGISKDSVLAITG